MPRRSKSVRSLADALLAVLLAPTCAACDQPLDEPTISAVCRPCWASIQPLHPPLCETCGDALPSWRTVSTFERQCARCRRLPRVITTGRAIAPYDGRLRDILHALKYDGRRSLAEPLAKQMAAAGTEVLKGADYAVPVPLHAIRRHQRGFNQAEEIARHLPLPMLRALRRRRWTATQTDLPEAQRHRNVRDAFAVTWRGRRSLTSAVVVLVDDVSTTGATLDACARVLVDAGVKEVRALTAARAASKLR
jgi:ComF family protein